MYDRAFATNEREKKIEFAIANSAWYIMRTWGKDARRLSIDLDDLQQEGRLWYYENKASVPCDSLDHLYAFVYVSCKRRFEYLLKSTSRFRLMDDLQDVKFSASSRNSERLNKLRDIVREYAKITPKCSQKSKVSLTPQIALMTLDNYEQCEIAKILGRSNNSINGSLRDFAKRARRDLAGVMK